MTSDGWVPEIVVGVDFGMTCTGMFASLEDEISILFASHSRSPKILGASRRRVFHGPGLGRAKDSAALAGKDD